MKKSQLVLVILCLFTTVTILSSFVKEAKTYTKVVANQEANQTTFYTADSICHREKQPYSFKHLVVDYPHHQIYVHRNEKFSGIAFETELKDLQLSDMVKVEVRNDTLYLTGILSLLHQPIKDTQGDPKSFGSIDPLAVEGVLPYLISIQTNDLESATIKEYGKLSLYLKPSGSPLNLQERKTWIGNTKQLDTLPLEPKDLHLKQHANSHCIASVHLNTVYWENFGHFDGSNIGYLNGRTRKVILDNPKVSLSGNPFKTDSLFVHARGKDNFGEIELKVEKYLYANLQSKRPIEVLYSSSGPITIEKNTNSYGLVADRRRVQ